MVQPRGCARPTARPGSRAAQGGGDGHGSAAHLARHGYELSGFPEGSGEENLTVLAESPSPEYLDATAQWDRTYEYAVQALRDQAASEVSPPVPITPKDVFPPAVPTGLTAISGVGTIEVGWERNTEADLRGYRLYRAPENGDFQRLGDLLEIPAYSDKQIETGKRYRYAVTSMDQAGNESARSAVVEALAP